MNAGRQVPWSFGHVSLLLVVAVGVLGAVVCGDEPSRTPDMPAEFSWPELRTEHRPGCYWWWPGNAVDKANITWNLQQLHDAGFGGVHIVPIYGVKGQEERYLDYLSPAWLEMLAHTVAEAQRLGMWVDMTTGTGWPFGGPNVSDADADVIASYEDGAIKTRIGRRVKRPAPGGAGNCVNPFSVAALSRYLRRFDQAFAAYQGQMPRAQYHDSFEYAGNWCGELFDAFQARRGYDLHDHLAELFGQGDPDTVARIKSDYRQTLAGLHLEFIRAWARWANQKGCLARNQAHGAPGNLLDLYAAADIPETETFGSTPLRIPGLRRDPANVRRRGNSTPMVNRFASSAAHVSGKRLVASEACTWLRNHFTTALSQVKPEIDQLLVGGVNQLVYHGCCYSPQGATWPGWLFYASTEFNHRNAFWRDVPALNDYVARCQSVMQSGQPANDVLLYWPVYDVWHDPKGTARPLTVHDTKWLRDAPCGRVAARLVERGYTFDFISDSQLHTLRVEGNTLVAPGGQYRVVVVPKCDHMPVATWLQLAHLASKGATVLVHEALPEDAPGYANLHARRKRLKDSLGQLVFESIEGSAIGQATLGNGRVLLGDDVEALLTTAGVPREPVVDLGIGFARRRHDQGYHYFLANLGDQTVDQWVRLGTPCESVVIMDPRTAATGLAKLRQQAGRAEVYLQLAPGESLILRTLDRKVQGPAWRCLEDTGQPIAIEGQWQVEFIDGGPALPAPFATERLASWTTLGDDEAQRFAGTAKYTIEFELPAAQYDDYVLDLGELRESARVRLGGRDVGTLWSIPFRTAVGAYLRQGRNRLEIEVTNLSANRIRDLDRRGVEWRIFHDINFVTQEYRKFDASNWPLFDSGLLGPVMLQPKRKK